MSSSSVVLPSFFVVGDYPGLDFDVPEERQERPIYEKIDRSDIYKEQFFPEDDHLNFIGLDKSGFSYVVSVMGKSLESQPFVYSGLVTTGKKLKLSFLLVAYRWKSQLKSICRKIML
jgi:hypothetical protein